MTIHTSIGELNSEKDSMLFVFEDDEEYSSFMTRLLQMPVRTSGIRILTMIPENMKLNPVQEMILEVIEGLDGAGSDNQKENDAICNSAIDKLNKLIDDN